jgi:hypothetical protein
VSGLAGLGLLAKLSGAKATLAKVPPKVWYGLAIVAALVASILVHQHYAHKALKAADAAGYARAAKEDADALVALRKRAEVAEANAKAIAQDIRNRNDETNRAIAADAASLKLRGPGAASCRRISDPALPATRGQPVAADHQRADAAPGQVLATDGQPDLAAVPWQWLVGRAEQCDLDRAESLSWRDWYARQSAEWAKLKGGK